MKTNLKSLEVNKLTSRITLEHSNSKETYLIPLEVEAIAVLLGGYNKYGRKIPIERHEKRKAIFMGMISEIMEEIK